MPVNDAAMSWNKLLTITGRRGAMHILTVAPTARPLPSTQSLAVTLYGGVLTQNRPTKNLLAAHLALDIDSE